MAGSSSTVFFSSSFFFLPFITFGALLKAVVTLVEDFLVLSLTSGAGSLALTGAGAEFFFSSTFFSSGFFAGSFAGAGLTDAGSIATGFLSAGTT